MNCLYFLVFITSIGCAQWIEEIEATKTRVAIFIARRDVDSAAVCYAASCGASPRGIREEMWLTSKSTNLDLNNRYECFK